MNEMTLKWSSLYAYEDGTTKRISNGGIQFNARLILSARFINFHQVGENCVRHALKVVIPRVLQRENKYAAHPFQSYLAGGIDFNSSKIVHAIDNMSQGLNNMF